MVGMARGSSGKEGGLHDMVEEGGLRGHARVMRGIE